MTSSADVVVLKRQTAYPDKVRGEVFSGRVDRAAVERILDDAFNAVVALEVSNGQ